MNQAGIAEQAPARMKREVLKLGRKPQAATSTPGATPAIVVAPSVPELVPLGKLRRAAENVRHIRVDEDCEMMADGIQAHGLLQCLIGYRDGGFVEVVDGGRRLKGMRIVRSRGVIDDDFVVPVLIRSMDEAIELSLEANLQHRTMSPVDEFRAFALLMERGDISPAGLAKRFGLTETLVRQRLRLAKLATPVLDALAERQITLDAAMAYATSQDTALQAEVFENQRKRGRTAHEPANVKHALRMKGIDTASRLYRLVGAAAYEREGGGYEDDLFNEAGKERVLAQPFVLETLAQGAVDMQATRLIGELQRDPSWAPTIVGFVKVPDLFIHRWGTANVMRPPAGFALVEKAESEKLWRTIRNNGLNVHVVVGVDEEGRVVASHRYAFVPVGQKTAVDRPAALVDVAADRERSAAAEREREIVRWSRRLAAPRIAGTPLEGRALWPEPIYDRQVPHQLETGESGYIISLMVFVPDAEIAAHRKEAAAKVDQLLGGKGEA